MAIRLRSSDDAPDRPRRLTANAGRIGNVCGLPRGAAGTHLPAPISGTFGRTRVSFPTWHQCVGSSTARSICRHRTSGRITPYLFALQNMVIWGMGLPLGLAAWAGFLLVGVVLIRSRRDGTGCARLRPALDPDRPVFWMAGWRFQSVGALFPVDLSTAGALRRHVQRRGGLPLRRRSTILTTPRLVRVASNT